MFIIISNGVRMFKFETVEAAQRCIAAMERFHQAVNERHRAEWRRACPESNFEMGNFNPVHHIALAMEAS